MRTKICSACNISQPLTTQHFRQRFYKNGKPYFRSHCIECQRRKSREHYAKNHERIRQTKREHYYKNYEKEQKRSRESMRKWREKGDNLKIVNQRMKARYHKNIEKSRIRARKYYWKTIEKQRQWAIESYYRNHKVIFRRNIGIYGFNKKSIAAANHRAKKFGCVGKHNLQDIQELYIEQRKYCYWCACDLTKINRHVDHIVPLSKMGSNDKSNLCITCSTCNFSKGNKMPEEWMSILLSDITLWM